MSDDYRDDALEEMWDAAASSDPSWRVPTKHAVVEASTNYGPMPNPYDRMVIRTIVGQFHVGTPDIEVARDMWRRIDASIIATRADRYAQACVEYALEEHHHNQDMYRTVTGSI